MKKEIINLTYMSILLSLLIIGSKISINIGVIPITLQTFCVVIISHILKFKKAFIVFTIYIILGLIGIPIFSNGGGLYYIYKPSFGFIIGFLFSSIFIGNFSNKKHALYIKAILGLLVINVIGLLYMGLILKYYYHTKSNFLYLLEIGFIPFIIKDLISTILATTVYLRIKIIIPDAIQYKQKEKIL